MRLRWMMILMVCLWLSRECPGQEYSFGRVDAEQIEQVFLRSDRAGKIESATASLTVNAESPSPGEQALVELQNNGTPVMVGRADGSVETAGRIVGDSLRQLYGGATEREVAIQEDDQANPRQATFYGTCSNGSVTFSSDGWESFKPDCTPVIVLTPRNLSTGDVTDPYHYWWTLTSVSSTGFSYKIYLWYFDIYNGNYEITNSDVTSSVTVHWQAMGWLD